MGYDRMIENFYGNAQYPGLSGPSHWQDPDMMVVGMEGLTETEWVSHFSLWCMSAAPLWIGIDLTIVQHNVLSILNNSEVIAVDQDVLGMAAIQIDQSMNANYNQMGQVYWKILSPQKDENSANAVLLFNPSNATMANIGLGFDEIGLINDANVRNLWTHEDLGRMSNFSAE